MIIMIIIDEVDRVELRRLCLRHSFHYDVLGNYLRIHSKRDTWYILDRNYDGRLIELEHQNQYDNARFHKQGKHKNLENIFKSIKSHDSIFIPGHRNNKLTRITNTFKLLGLYN